MKSNNMFATQWFPEVLMGMVAVAIYLISNIIFYIITYSLISSFHLLLFLSQLFSIVIMLSLFVWQKKKLNPDISFNGVFRWNDYKICMLIWVVIVLFFAVISSLFDVHEEVFLNDLLKEKSVNIIIITCIDVVVFAPIIEEIMFRHFILAMFPFNRGGKWAARAIIFSAFLFSFAHTQYVYTVSHVYIFALGILLALARMISQGLLLPILLHASFNCIALVFYFL